MIQSVAYLKQSLEEPDIMGYSWKQGEEIVADIFTKQGSTRAVLEEIIKKNKFRHPETRDNWVVFENEEFKAYNLVTKRGKELKRGKWFSPIIKGVFT